MKTKDLKMKVKINAPAHEIYEALMDSKKHSHLTQAKASISREIGGKVSAYDDYVDAENLELIPDKKIVQKWRASDWPEGHFSKVTFEFNEKNGETELMFSQTSIPQEDCMVVDAEGWDKYYWAPLKLMLEKD